jgi:hypothetical protein
MKLREVSAVSCEEKIPMSLKGKFYRKVMRPTMLYGSGCWVVDRRIEQSMSVAKIRML